MPQWTPVGRVVRGFGITLACSPSPMMPSERAAAVWTLGTGSVTSSATLSALSGTLQIEVCPRLVEALSATLTPIPPALTGRSRMGLQSGRRRRYGPLLLGGSSVDEAQGPRLRSSCAGSATEDCGLLVGFEADAEVETPRCWVVRSEAELDAHCAGLGEKVDAGGE